jgi:hypothetical protein
MKFVSTFFPSMVPVSVICICTQVASAQSRPTLYPSEKVKSMTTAQLDSAISSCEAAAKAATSVGNQNAGGATVRKAAKGAALGAMAGAITKQNVGRSAGAGAAVGGTVSVIDNAKTKREGSPEYRNYVSACLDEKGLKVVGWK